MKYYLFAVLFFLSVSNIIPISSTNRENDVESHQISVTEPRYLTENWTFHLKTSSPCYFMKYIIAENNEQASRLVTEVCEELFMQNVTSLLRAMCPQIKEVDFGRSDQDFFGYARVLRPFLTFLQSSNRDVNEIINKLDEFFEENTQYDEKIAADIENERRFLPERTLREYGCFIDSQLRNRDLEKVLSNSTLSSVRYVFGLILKYGDEISQIRGGLHDGDAPVRLIKMFNLKGIKNISVGQEEFSTAFSCARSNRTNLYHLKFTRTLPQKVEVHASLRKSDHTILSTSVRIILFMIIIAFVLALAKRYGRSVRLQDIYQRS